MPYDSDPRKPYQVDAPPMAPAAEDDIAPPPVQIEPEPEPLPAPSDGGEGGAGGSALAVEALRQSVDEGRAEGTDSAREILRRGAELYRAAASAASEGDRPARDDLMSRRTSLLRERLGSSRVFLLYITKNDHVQAERKLTVRASSMDELLSKVRDELELPEAWDFVLCKAAGSSVGHSPNPVPYEEFSQVTTRAVVQLWPRLLFAEGGEGAEEGSEAARRAELYRAAVRGDEEAVSSLLAELPRPPLVDAVAAADAEEGAREDGSAGSGGEEGEGEEGGEGGRRLRENSALHAAAYYGAVGCLSAFLDAWGNTACNLRNEHAQTALHCAARGGQLEALELLLSAGADVTALDAEDQTARDAAIRDGHKAAARVLEAPEVEKKATELGVYADRAWERRLESAQSTIEGLEARLAEQEETNAATVRCAADNFLRPNRWLVLSALLLLRRPRMLRHRTLLAPGPSEQHCPAAG